MSLKTDISNKTLNIMNKEHKKKRISNLTLISIIFACILLFGLIFLKRPAFEYKISTNEMLEEALKQEDLIRLDKFMQIYFNDDTLYRFIDLRSAHDFLKDHIPGAINIPLHKILDTEYKPILSQNTKINILYNSDQSGACGPWMILKQIGYKNNRVLQGGYDIVKKNIIEKFSPMSASFQSETLRFDISKLINSGSSTNVSETEAPTSNSSKTNTSPKKKKTGSGGGC